MFSWWRVVLTQRSSITLQSKSCGVSVRDCVCAVQCVLSMGVFDTTAKMEAAISHIENKQYQGKGEMIRNHFSKRLKIFEATSETNKNIKLLLNSLNIILQTSIELERVEHD